MAAAAADMAQQERRDHLDQWALQDRPVRRLQGRQAPQVPRVPRVLVQLLELQDPLAPLVVEEEVAQRHMRRCLRSPQVAEVEEEVVHTPGRKRFMTKRLDVVLYLILLRILALGVDRILVHKSTLEMTNQWTLGLGTLKILLCYLNTIRLQTLPRLLLWLTSLGLHSTYPEHHVLVRRLRQYIEPHPE